MAAHAPVLLSNCTAGRALSFVSLVSCSSLRGYSDAVTGSDGATGIIMLGCLETGSAWSRSSWPELAHSLGLRHGPFEMFLNIALGVGEAGTSIEHGRRHWRITYRIDQLQRFSLAWAGLRTGEEKRANCIHSST